MKRFLHALAVLYSLVALGLLNCAVTSYQHGSWPFTLFFTAAAVCLATATFHHGYHQDELRFARARLERATRPATPATDAVVAVALAGACCERWWTSAGAEHEPTTCTRKDSAA